MKVDMSSWPQKKKRMELEFLQSHIPLFWWVGGGGWGGGGVVKPPFLDHAHLDHAQLKLKHLYSLRHYFTRLWCDIIWSHSQVEINTVAVTAGDEIGNMSINNRFLKWLLVFLLVTGIQVCVIKTPLEEYISEVTMEQENTDVPARLISLYDWQRRKLPASESSAFHRQAAAWHRVKKQQLTRCSAFVQALKYTQSRIQSLEQRHECYCWDP